MKPGEPLKTSKPIRSHKTGIILPREGTFVRAIENMGRQFWVYDALYAAVKARLEKGA